jgi:hypothetical protein
LLKKLQGDSPANASKVANSTTPAKKNTSAPANASKAANATAPANASKAANATAPANGSKAANSTAPAGNATTPANGTVKANSTKKSGGAGFAPGADPVKPAEADAVAAEADGEKADVMYRFAKKKVDDLIAGIKALDEHVKNEFLALEKIL